MAPSPETAGFAVANQVQPVTAPTLAVAWVREKLFNETLIRAVGFVGEEGVEVGEGRRDADEIEIEASSEGAARGFGGGAQAGAVEPGEDEAVDWRTHPGVVLYFRERRALRLLERPTPLLLAHSGLLGGQRAHPCLHFRDGLGRQRLAHRHRRLQLAFEELHQRARFGVTGHYGLAMLVAAADHRFHGGDREAARLGLVRVTSAALRLKQWPDRVKVGRYGYRTPSKKYNTQPHIDRFHSSDYGLGILPHRATWRGGASVL